MSMIQHRITDKFVWKASISKITNKDFSILHNRFCDYTLLIFTNFTPLLLCKTFHRCSGLSHRHLTFHLCTYNNGTYQFTELTSWNVCCPGGHCSVCVTWFGGGRGEKRTRLLLAFLEQGFHFLLFGARKLNFFLSLSWTF